MRRSVVALSLVLASAAAVAQLSAPDPDWKESEVPAPAPLKTTGLIAFEVERSTLRYGVDPASLAIGADRVVRYVVVASSGSGAINAMYEGIRCNTGEVRTYARHSPGSGWVRLPDADWRPLHGSASTRHSLILARGGVCLGHSPNQSVEHIARDLRAPADMRFRSEAR